MTSDEAQLCVTSTKSATLTSLSLSLSLSLLQEDEYKANSADAWHLRDGCTRGIIEHVLITFVLFSGALGIALGVTNLGVVTEISGSVSAVFLAFVLPAAIRLRLGPTPDDTLPTFHRNNWASWFVLAFGLLAFVTSTGFTLVEIITGKEFSLGQGQ